MKSFDLHSDARISWLNETGPRPFLPSRPISSHFSFLEFSSDREGSIADALASTVEHTNLGWDNVILPLLHFSLSLVDVSGTLSLFFSFNYLSFDLKL